MGTLNDLVCRGEDEKFSSLNNRSRVLDILRQITKDVRHLHLLKIVHGNLKPSNILVSYQRGDLEPMMKLADFAIRHAVRDQNGVTRFQLAFTEGWMCPTDDPIASSFDIFPLGCLYAFTASNGTHAFGSDHISRISNKRPMTLTLNQLVRNLQSISFLGLIGEMINFNAEERPTVLEILAHPIFNQQPISTDSSQQQPKVRTDHRIFRPSASAFNGQLPSTSPASFTTPIRKSATEPLDENR
jgi:serine/threonine protein kinase